MTAKYTIPAQWRLRKVAWIREPGHPQGQPAPGRRGCPCGQAPLSDFNDRQPDITCACGAVYSWDGTVISRQPIITACGTCNGTGRIMHWGGVELGCHVCQSMGGIELPSCLPALWPPAEETRS